MKGRRAGLIVAILVASSALAVLTAAQQPVFRAAVDSIELNVAVLSGSKPVAGLTIYDFEVTDNGVPQPVTSVSREAMPIDVTLVIDTSGSITPNLANAIVGAVNKIRGRLRSEDRISLMTFNQIIHERIALSPTAGVKGVELGKTVGWTSLNDAIAVALSTPPPVERRQMAIIFTDGYDTMSFLDEASVLAAAGRSRTAAFVVTRPQNLGATPEAFFDRLADVTGGVVQIVSSAVMVVDKSPGSTRITFRPNDDLLDASFIKALEDFRTSYVVRYTLTGVKRSGWHDVAVKVTKAGKTYDVRTRKGYQG
jgi:hypothetical protein